MTEPVQRGLVKEQHGRTYHGILEQEGSCAATCEAVEEVDATQDLSKVDVTLSASLEVIQTQLQTTPRFYHPLFQWKGPTPLHDHGLHPYLLGIMKGLGLLDGFCC